MLRAPGRAARAAARGAAAPRRLAHHPASEYYIGSVDNGTTSTRFRLYDSNFRVVAQCQQKTTGYTPEPGWIEQCADEIYDKTAACMEAAMAELTAKDPDAARKVAGIGITNQRETVLVWDKASGRPLHRAVVWCDVRSDGVAKRVERANGKDCYRALTGLPCSYYFSGYKLRWMMDNSDAVRDALAKGTALIGTIDSWLAWRLTGGAAHVSDVTNASRTSLMDLARREWDDGLCGDFGVPRAALPRIVKNAESVGSIAQGRPLAGVPITGMIGDQQSATVGQGCFAKGDVKNTYGTGVFMVMNTGADLVQSKHGLLTTMGYHVGNDCHYALEGASLQGGQLIEWLLGIGKKGAEGRGLFMIDSLPEVEELASAVADTGGVAIVPAFQGLLTPHWDSSARGVICGLTMQTGRAHICRAALTSIAMQSAEVVRAMEQDTGLDLRAITVDGGAVTNKLLMQLQADLADVRINVPADIETTAMGAALCASVGCGAYPSLAAAMAAQRAAGGAPSEFTPQIGAERRAAEWRAWDRALQSARGWVDA